MGPETCGRAVRPALVLAALGAALTGCGLPQDGYGRSSPYSYSSPSYYSSPDYYNSRSNYRNHYRNESYHRPSSPPRAENSTQQRLQQHWINQAQRPR